MTLILKNLTISNTWIKNVSFSIKKGRIAVVVGPRGCGITTFLNEIYNPSILSKNHVLFEDKYIKDMKSKVQFVPASMYSFFNEERTIESILDDTYLMPMCLNDWRTKIKAFPNLLKIIAYTAKMLTNEEKQLFACFRAFLFEPELFICDEFLCMSDFYKNQNLIAEIKKIKENALILVSSKNLPFIAEMCDVFIYITKNGVTVFDSKDDVMLFLETAKQHLEVTSIQEEVSEFIMDFFSRLIRND